MTAAQRHLVVLRHLLANAIARRDWLTALIVGARIRAELERPS